ncbi:MAG TPA: YggT family protein [Firmicutes bacterium]|jgi:YggT family protein|nr:YggT family protein [Bacillota bacterium]
MKLLIKLVSRLYNIVLILRIVINWLDLSPEAYPPVKLVYRLTEPVLEPLRRLINTKAGFDLSPLLAIILVWLLAKILVDLF